MIPYSRYTAVIKKMIMRPISFNGLNVTLLDCVSAKHGPDWVHGDHRHPWFEFNYVSAGAVYTTLEGQEFRIEAGESYLIPPGAVHSHRHAEHAGDDGFCLRWQCSETGLKPEADASGFDAARWIETLAAPRPYPIDGRMDALLSAMERGRALPLLQAGFVAWLLSLCETKEDETLPKRHGEEDHLVRQTLIYLEEYYATDFSVQDIAKSLHVSYRNLVRVFKSKTGLTIIEKLNDIRIRHAMKLLRETSLPMREIAARVGFENEYYFSNTFHRYADCSPSQFRKRTRE